MTVIRAIMSSEHIWCIFIIRYLYIVCTQVLGHLNILLYFQFYDMRGLSEKQIMFQSIIINY